MTAQVGNKFNHQLTRLNIYWLLAEAAEVALAGQTRAQVAEEQEAQLTRL